MLCCDNYSLFLLSWHAKRTYTQIVIPFVPQCGEVQCRLIEICFYCEYVLFLNYFVSFLL